MDRDLREAARRLDELDVVQGHEGLQRGVGALAVDGALLARGRVEGLHRRRRGRALPERVEAAPVVRLAPVGDVDLRVALLHRHDLPEARRLVGFDARSADLRGQLPRRHERQITDHLAVHPEARPPGKQAIVRVLLELQRCGGRGLAIGRGRDHEPEEGLHVPSGLPELDRQPVEQLRVRRRLPGDAEFSHGGNEALSEDLRPEAVDVDAGGERMVRIGQPLRQPQAVGGGPLGQRGEGRRDGGLDLVSLLVVLAAYEDVREGFLALLLLGDERHLGPGLHRLEFVDAGVTRIPEPHRVRVEEVEIVVPEGLQQLPGPLLRARGERRGEHAATGEHLHLRGQKRAPIEPDVVDGGTFRPLAGAAPVESQRRPGADGPAERIHFLIDFLGLAVVVDLDAFGLPRAVVGDEEVMPSFRLHGGPRHHAHGVLVPGADDLYPGAAALHVQLPTAVAIRHVHASEEGAVDGVGDLDPGAEGESLIGLDVAQIAQVGGDALRKADPRAHG